MFVLPKPFSRKNAQTRLLAMLCIQLDHWTGRRDGTVTYFQFELLTYLFIRYFLDHSLNIIIFNLHEKTSLTVSTLMVFIFITFQLDFQRLFFNTSLFFYFMFSFLVYLFCLQSLIQSYQRFTCLIIYATKQIPQIKQHYIWFL